MAYQPFMRQSDASSASLLPGGNYASRASPKSSPGPSSPRALPPRAPPCVHPPPYMLTSSPSIPAATVAVRQVLARGKPRRVGTYALANNQPEPDDYLHNPDPKRDHRSDGGGTSSLPVVSETSAVSSSSPRILMLLLPLYSYFTRTKYTTQGGFNLGATNATGQGRRIPGFPGGLIDTETPQEAHTRASFSNPGDEWELVFSDEFNTDGRSFYPGDDPWWEAADLHYWQTNDLEWYDPKQVTTKDGYLRLKIEKVADPSTNHDLNYISGMLQSWNKFCFTGGMVEVAVQLPGSPKVAGFWPAVWTMGNLGRAGYGASLDGTWPYSYDSCDVGTLPNQTYPGTQTPLAALENGDPQHGGVLSYLEGQRLSACTCPGEPHPGPVHANGSYVGRSAPEIDVFEATVGGGLGQVSQSGQWAPFNAAYLWQNTTDNIFLNATAGTQLNSYVGGAYQQTTSGVTDTAQECYELAQGCFSVYAYEYQPGTDGYITWVQNGSIAWSMKGAGMGPDPATEIQARPVPQEPMYILMNLGFSTNFVQIDFDNIQFPAEMLVDYVRVYQPKGSKNIGCDPPDFPTAQYIDTYIEAYTNPNLTLWGQGGGGFGQPNPKNRLLNGGTC